MHIDWLNEIEGPRQYGYLTDKESGVLIVRDPAGDTLIPPFEGRFTVLEEVSSREDALDAARQWEAQCSRSR